MRNLIFSFYIALLIPLSVCSEELRIGLITSLSDEWASMGRSIVQGAELARDDVNASGGIQGRQIRLLIEDAQEANSGAVAVSVYRSLRQRKVEFFVGPLGTPAALSLAPIIAKDPVVIVSATVGVRDFSDGGSNIFNIRGVDETSSRSMAKYAIESGKKRAAVLASQQPWESVQGKAFADEFEKLGGEIVAHEEPLPDANDLRTPVAKILRSKPEIIFFGSFNRLPLGSREFARQGYKGPKLAALLDGSTVKLAEGALEGTIFVTMGGPTAEFQEKFKNRYNEQPGFGADLAYDALTALALSMKSSNSIQPQPVADHLREIRFSGAAGAVYFDKDRIAVRALQKFQVAQGEIKPLQ